MYSGVYGNFVFKLFSSDSNEQHEKVPNFFLVLRKTGFEFFYFSSNFERIKQAIRHTTA